MVQVITGNNFYLTKRELSKVKEDFEAQNGEMSVEEIDCEEIEPEVLLNALQSTPLFSEKKLIIAKNIARNKKLSGQIEQVISSAESGNNLIIVERNLDKRGAYYKSLKANSEVKEYNEQDEQDLISWTGKEAKTLGANLSGRNARYLVGRIGQNQQLLASELAKLAAFDKDITKENIDTLIPPRPQSSIFNLLDSAFAGNTKTTLKIYEEQKAQGAQPQSIFGMVIWQANTLAAVAAKGSMSSKELSEATGMKPFSINKAEGIYKRIGRGGVNKLLDKLVAADKQMKTQSSDPDEVLKNLLVTIS